MNIGQICQRRAVTVQPTDELRTAAKLMRENHIGFLVVVQPSLPEGGQEPIGVITDRDIVVSTLALDVDPKSVSVGDVMTPKPAVALAQDSVADAIHQMRHRGVRRLPVVGDYGKLIGVIALDDILTRHADEVGAAAAVIVKARDEESRSRV
jgi:CBS domain-containing protein